MSGGHYTYINENGYVTSNYQSDDAVNPSAEMSELALHGAYGGGHVNFNTRSNNLYMPNGFNPMIMQDSVARPMGSLPLPQQQQPNLYYTSVVAAHHTPEMTRTRTVRVRPQHTNNPPYQSTNAGSSSRQGIRRRTPPQSNQTYSFDNEIIIPDPVIGSLPTPSVHVPSSEAWSHLPPNQTSPYSSQRHPQTPSVSSTGPSVEAAVAFAQASFPIGTPDYARKQAEMYEVLMSDWKQNNQFEPNPEALLRFATKENGFWMCAFYVDGRRCQRSLTDRQRQIVEHIRRHIKLEPYACEGPCPTSPHGCGKRYSSGDPLRKHRDGNLRGESTCELCGRTLLPGNIIRHQNNSCRETGH